MGRRHHGSRGVHQHDGESGLHRTIPPMVHRGPSRVGCAPQPHFPPHTPMLCCSTSVPRMGVWAFPIFPTKLTSGSGPFSADCKNAEGFRPSQLTGCSTGQQHPRVDNSSPPRRGLHRPTLCHTAWSQPLRQSLSPAHSWSVYSDSSRKVATPIQAQAVFGQQGSHLGRGALFLSADLPDWCSDVTALNFEIPLTLRAVGGTAHLAELLAIQTGLQLL